MSKSDTKYDSETEYIERPDQRRPEEIYKKIEETLEYNMENKHYPLFLMTSILVPIITLILVVVILIIIIK